MSVKPSLYSYVNSKGDLYLKRGGVYNKQLVDKQRVITTIPPNTYKVLVYFLKN